MSFPSRSKISLMTTNASQLLAAAWLFRAVAYMSFSDVQRSFTPFGSESSPLDLSRLLLFICLSHRTWCLRKAMSTSFTQSLPLLGPIQPLFPAASLFSGYPYGRHSVLWLHGHHARRLSKPCSRLASDSDGCSSSSSLATDWGLCLHFELLGHSSPISGDF